MIFMFLAGALQTAFPAPDGHNLRKVRLEINTDANLKLIKRLMPGMSRNVTEHTIEQMYTDVATSRFLRKGCQFVLHKKPNESSSRI